MTVAGRAGATTVDYGTLGHRCIGHTGHIKFNDQKIQLKAKIFQTSSVHGKNEVSGRYKNLLPCAFTVA